MYKETLQYNDGTVTFHKRKTKVNLNQITQDKQ